MENASDFIMNLKPFVYKWDAPDYDSQFHRGFGAQQVESTLDSLNMYDYGVVTIPNESEGIWGLNYTEIIAPLVKVVQNQQKAIEQLEAEIERLKR